VDSDWPRSRSIGGGSTLTLVQRAAVHKTSSRDFHATAIALHKSVDFINVLAPLSNSIGNIGPYN